MSTVEQNTSSWSKLSEPLDSKYEKCRNITEEIYKRINITFQIKKLETAKEQTDISEQSDVIDSNELSNETDLFACDKDSLTSTDVEKPRPICEKYININNNEETKKTSTVVYKRPRKRFRKRVKKRQSRSKPSDSDGSSDEALPLSRMVELDTVKSDQAESPDNVMGVPNIVIIAREMKPKICSPLEKKQSRKQISNITDKVKTTDTQKSHSTTTTDNKTDEDKNGTLSMDGQKCGNTEWKYCTMCTLSFRGERGLRRHMTMSHILTTQDTKKSI
ncbi:hypothetical protein K1T71_000691 [Dendrolimus kikuchii]|uniref:Uncharacterized protein n=1 Tax=Dendrolimus kikuchii TaxID=765133 RepID=A0ACC1DJY3_9NEOP|nr:hypothetical protein K1T71_000691 [Dendrolimus kikuchii]